MSREILKNIIENFEPEKLERFFREKNNSFRPIKEDLDEYDDENFTKGYKLGEIDFEEEASDLMVCSFEVQKELSERSGKRDQYEKAKKILKETETDAGIFIFYDKNGNFRFSLIYTNYLGKKREWNNFKRFTYFVRKDLPNKTFLNQIGQGGFEKFENIREAFSLAKVTKEFYNDFNPVFQDISDHVFCKYNSKISKKEKGDFALLFVIRVVLIGFIQKKKWIGNDEKFLQNLWKEYKENHHGEDNFYLNWLRPLFFEALNAPPGRKVAYQDNDFSVKTEKNLQMAPYLNGGLFQERELDKRDLYLSDQAIEKFLDFIFSYNFTIEENTLYDEELELNPEFLGIIFERLVNKENGAIYTPRVEVDYMCRLSLVKWLAKNNTTNIEIRDLYELFFVEGGKGDEYKDKQRTGSFSKNQYEDILELLEKITICDPAIGSGAFAVGMLHVINEIESHIYEKLGESNSDAFERKKRIISKSLYGVEIKEWAVWITQLRLWITLFIEAGDEMRQSSEPILPSLDFKIRPGDSLVQVVGSKMFPIDNHAYISKRIKDRTTKLKKMKADYFYNGKDSLEEWRIKQTEIQIYREILEDEITSLQTEVKSLRNKKFNCQTTLLDEDNAGQRKQLRLDSHLNKVKAVKLENRINELEEQKNNLKKKKPLIWSIEFAEIFIEKGGFDLIIGNPPYVRQELISDPTGKIKDKKEYKKKLAEMVRMDFPDYFSEKNKTKAQSDLYTYFYIRGLKLLNTNGILTYICSNSWLDVGYGVWLQKFLLDRCPIGYIIDNHAKRSFGEADINTIISVINAPTKKINKDHLVKFLAFKKPFEKVIFTENLLEAERANEIIKNELLRIYPITVEQLNENGMEYENEEQKKMKTGKYIGDKWGGKYLRAPDIFFTVLKKGEDKLVKLGDIADIKRGFTTGANEFFYLTKQEVREWKIEPEFLKPVIKSPRECSKILIEESDLNYYVFLCNKSKEELKGTNALKYIEWGEKKGFNKKPTVKGRNFWWSIKNHRPSDFIWTMTYRNRFFVLENKICLADARMYDMYSEDIYGYLSNSIITLLQLEIMARGYGGGGGPVDVKVYEVNNLLVPKIINNHDKLKKSFEKIKNREINTIFEEYGINPESEILIENQEPQPLPDRAELDKIVFDALDLTEEERKDVYRSVCRLVYNRINKAKNI